MLSPEAYQLVLHWTGWITLVCGGLLLSLLLLHWCGFLWSGIQGRFERRMLWHTPRVFYQLLSLKLKDWEGHGQLPSNTHALRWVINRARVTELECLRREIDERLAELSKTNNPDSQ